jgi:16S rRNA (guanine527-N7)-methyltransferase
VCSQNGLQLSDGQLQRLEKYSVGLLEWNKKINLISRRDEDNFWNRHILHCLSLIFKLDIPQGANILDLGTGGGLPGIVLKIARPDIRFTLLDSTQKKINVVKELIGSLDLAGIQAAWGRAEDLGKQHQYARRYDVIVARAVAPLKDLARWSYPFLKRNGMEIGAQTGGRPDPIKIALNTPALVAFKGGDLDDEISQLRNQPEIGLVTAIELSLRGSAQLDDRDKKIVVVEYVKSIK